jgi:UPF0716 protein FxsA
MPLLILLAFLFAPFVEIAVFIRVGEWIGIWPTIGLTMLSTAAGIALTRRHGVATLARAREVAGRGEAPVDEMLDGICILLAGALLIVPGFVTDGFGLLLFIPWVRRLVRRRVWRAFETQGRFRRARVIEADYAVVEEEGSAGDGHAPQPGRPRLRDETGGGEGRP